jgi:hypothetical protein
MLKINCTWSIERAYSHFLFDSKKVLHSSPLSHFSFPTSARAGPSPADTQKQRTKIHKKKQHSERQQTVQAIVKLFIPARFSVSLSPRPGF